MNRLGPCLVVMLLGLLCGCPPPNAKFAPNTATAAVARINANLERINQPIYARPALTSVRFHDENGRDYRFIGHPARVMFAAPRCLRFDIEHSLGGKIAEVGANDERYWLWKEPDGAMLWWGTWEAIEQGHARRLAVPPDQLIDILLFKPLPEQLPDGIPPLLDQRKYDRVLVYQRFNEAGWPYIAREVILKPHSDYLPAEIIDYRLMDDGQTREAMHAYLSGYKPVEDAGDDGPRTPRHYVVYWPIDGSELRLDLDRVRFRNIDVPCDFPTEWVGEQECLDTGLTPD
ncbi:MAG: hypothetical protein JXO22_03490 [Phycisphaerae bacterium]|nr:hypothetical protein [Phycisphaerae bacterium]